MPALPSPRPKTRPRLEIIPFIDIMFFLLATFMMVSLQMIQNEGLDVQLPVATATPLEDAERITLSVTEDGGYAWNDEPLNLDALVARLASVRSHDPDAKILIHGDGRAPFQAVVTVLDHARQLGLTRIAIQTRPAAAPPAP